MGAELKRQPPISSPCLRGACGLDDKFVCRRCLRTYDEIIGWGSMTEEQRLAIMATLSNRKTTEKAGSHP